MLKYLSLLSVFLIVSCNKPEKKNIQPKKDPQQNIALLIDNSLTMLSKDFDPNRITVVKNILKDIIHHKKDNQAFSIVIFAKNSYILCPLTKDRNQLLSAVNKLEVGIHKLDPGTNFSHVLLNGIRSLKTELNNKSMILISDGDENIKSYDLDIPIHDAIKNNITINTVVITPKDYAIEPSAMDIYGTMIFEKIKAKPIDSIKLKKISYETGGTFHVFYTKEEIRKFNFNQLTLKNKDVKPLKTSSSITVEKLSKIYKEIEMSNDSAAAIFNR